MRTCKLRTLLKIKNGSDHKALHDGIYPVFGSGGIMRYVDSYLYDKPSILLPRKGTLDNIQYVNTPFWTVDTTYYTEVDTSKVDVYFLYNYIKLLDLSKLNTGTGVPSMTFDSYYNLDINLPDLPTQKKIADVLSCIDDKITLNNKTNSELENMAKTVYDYWFTQFDFPDANGNPYKTSGGKMEYNQVLKREIPVGWEAGKLGFFLEKFGDGIHGTPEYDENGEYYFINGNNLGNKLISFGPETLKVNNTEYQKIKRPITDNSILLSINGTLGSISFYNGEKIAIGKSACFLNVKDEKSKPFVYQILSSEKFQKYMYKVAGGSTIKNFAPKQAADYDIIIPPIKLLEKFNEIASFYLIKQIKQEKESEELTKLRDYLLPLIMNGQIEVK